MKSAFALLLAAGAAASSIVARDLPTVLADLADIKSKVEALTPTIDAFQSLTNDAPPLLAAEKALEDAITKGTTDAQATDPVDVDGANQVLTAIKDLIPSIVTALNTAVRKAPDFAAVSADGILTDKLNSLKTLTDAFAAALIEKAPPEAQDAANAAIGCIDSGFNNALATPPTQATDCSGDIVLPGGGSGTTPPGGSEPSDDTTTTAPPTTTGITSPTGDVTLPPTTTPTGSGSGTSYPVGTPTTTGDGAVYTGAASLVSHSFVGAVCVAGLAFLL